MNTDTASQIAELLRPSLGHLGIDLVDVHWSGKGRGAVLRVVIDRQGGVTLDDCERVSNAASAVLDAYDPIDASYRLEVTSPGAERPIRSAEEWRQAIGRRVNVRLRSGDGERVVEGALMSLSVVTPVNGDAGGMHGTADVEVRDRRRTRLETIPLDEVVAARIVVDI